VHVSKRATDRGFRSDAMKQLLFAFLVSGFLADGIQSSPQKPTIPESVRAAGQSLRGISMKGSGPTPPLASFLKDVDVAVRGSIGEGTSYLSEDQRQVFTDYEILQPIYLFERRSIGAQRPAPPSARPIKVTLRGGGVQVGQFIYTEEDQTLPPLERGGDCLLLLHRDGQRYTPVGVYYGTFKIEGDSLIPLVKDVDFAPEYRQYRASAAISDTVARLIASRK
jgi:hypothetical protein